MFRFIERVSTLVVTSRVSDVRSCTKFSSRSVRFSSLVLVSEVVRVMCEIRLFFIYFFVSSFRSV